MYVPYLSSRSRSEQWRSQLWDPVVFFSGDRCDGNAQAACGGPRLDSVSQHATRQSALALMSCTPGAECLLRPPRLSQRLRKAQHTLSRATRSTHARVKLGHVSVLLIESGRSALPRVNKVAAMRHHHHHQLVSLSCHIQASTAGVHPS